MVHLSIQILTPSQGTFSFSLSSRKGRKSNKTMICPNSGDISMQDSERAMLKTHWQLLAPHPKDPSHLHWWHLDLIN